jgi:hypothetical protein
MIGAASSTPTGLVVGTARVIETCHGAIAAAERERQASRRR